jgi:citrate synthase
MTKSARTWIPRGEALERLGVKPQTLYAYVSRGRIAARPDPEDPRRSLYAAEDVVRLSDRTAPPGERRAPSFAGSAAGKNEAVIESAITAVVEGRLYFRGRDAAALAETATLEQAARLLWDAPEDPFLELKPRVDVTFPGGPRARAFAVLARRAEEDAAALGRGQRSLRREAASVLNEMVDAVAGGGPRLYLHQRLARAWKVQTDAQADLIRRALVLSADHEMGPPTLAARVTATSGASLAACALAGLCALTGPALGGRMIQAANLVAEARRTRDARGVLRQQFAQGLEAPGFGHPLYPDGDPRAEALLRTVALPEDLADIARVGEAMTGEKPNFDMALSLVCRHLDLPREAPFAVYAVGRTVGWLAHAIEQSASGSPVRARLRYVGLEPGA